MNVGLIGCGKIGWKRAQNLGDAKLVAVADPVTANQYNHTGPLGVPRFDSGYDLLEKADVDAVIIATPHNMLAPLTLAAVKAGKHVLVEKPGAIHQSEIDEINFEARERKLVVKVGYNLRFHPAIMKAHWLHHELGNYMTIRGYYGHGGRTGYEKEWRFDEKQSGGGVLMDLGVHLIDLTSTFFGQIWLDASMLKTYFWDTDLEDNATLVLRQMGGQSAVLQVSCTEWKNTFSFEIAGTEGKLLIEGLGGSYGTERLTHYKMKPEMGPPETTIWEFPGDDTSWELEFKDFVNHINHDTNHLPGVNMTRGASLYSASRVLEIVEAVYDHHKIAT
jgi:predicted dehydrogenase